MFHLQLRYLHHITAKCWKQSVRVNVLSIISYSSVSSITCGENSFLGEGLVIYDGELGQLDVLHSGHGALVASSLPVELDVVGGVSV